MKRAQPIGISAAPNIAGQARGEGERMAGSLYQSAAPVFVPATMQVAPESSARRSEPCRPFLITN
jgi:hypothetical protein